MLVSLLAGMDVVFGVVVYISILILSVWVVSAVIMVPLFLVFKDINRVILSIMSIVIVMAGLAVGTSLGYGLFGSGVNFSVSSDGPKLTVDPLLVSSAFNRVYTWTASVLNAALQNTIALSQNPTLTHVTETIIAAFSALSGFVVQLGAVAAAVISIRSVLNMIRNRGERGA
jgi:hypothetical protein